MEIENKGFSLNGTENDIKLLAMKKEICLKQLSSLADEVQNLRNQKSKVENEISEMRLNISQLTKQFELYSRKLNNIYEETENAYLTLESYKVSHKLKLDEYRQLLNCKANGKSTFSTASLNKEELLEKRNGLLKEVALNKEKLNKLITSFKESIS